MNPYDTLIEKPIDKVGKTIFAVWDGQVGMRLMVLILWFGLNVFNTWRLGWQAATPLFGMWSILVMYFGEWYWRHKREQQMNFVRAI